VRIAGVTFLRAPDLTRRFGVAAEPATPLGQKSGSVHAVERAPIGEEDAVGSTRKYGCPPRGAARSTPALPALAEPHALRPPSEMLFVKVAAT